MNQPEIDKLLKRRLYVQRYITQTFNDVSEALQPHDRELIRIIRDFIDDAAPGTLQALAQRNSRNANAAAVIREIKALLRKERDVAKEITKDATEQLLAREVIVTQNAVNEDKAPPSSAGLVAMAVAGYTLSERFQHTFSLINRRVISTIATAADSAPQSIVPLIRGTRAQRFRDGVFFWRDNRLLRPEIDVVINGGSGQAANRVYRANEIEHVDWLATLDYRTCIICRRNEALSPYPINKQPPYTAHPRCRCVLLPVVDPDRTAVARPYVRDDRSVKDIPKDERPGKIGQTRDTIEQFFGRMSAADLRDYLGPSRYKLWRDGKIDSVADLVDSRNNRPLRLDELPE